MKQKNRGLPPIVKRENTRPVADQGKGDGHLGQSGGGTTIKF